MASYIIVWSSVRYQLSRVKTCFPLSFSSVLESPGVNPISISSTKNIENLQMNINGYELSNYRYPLNCNISTELRHSDYENLFQFLPRFRQFRV